ncbi:MAG TPA: hypothetical protein VKU94_03990 [Geobacterales bacterium]|nr:hypothetical protein [Geobacterales bacterium]
MDKKLLAISFLISSAIIVAILSVPDIMEALANSVLEKLGVNLIFLALLFIGIIHGLKPDEHTWPITIPYALAQKDLKRAILASFVFTGALTLVWTFLSLAVSQIFLFINPQVTTPYADLIAGITMIIVACLFILRSKRNENGLKTSSPAPDYKYIWIHGLAASFGGDFIVVLILTSVLIGSIIPSSIGFMIGLMFGVGSMLAQSLVVMAAYKSAKSIVKNADMMARSGILSLFFLGIFLVGLGIVSFIGFTT